MTILSIRLLYLLSSTPVNDHIEEWSNDYDITEVFFSQESSQQYSSIGSDKDLALGTRQAIIWTNDVKFTDICMRHSASMSSPSALYV